MASNAIPVSYNPVVNLLEDAADGAQAHGVAVGLKQNDATTLRADLGALVGKPAGPGNVPPSRQRTENEMERGEGSTDNS